VTTRDKALAARVGGNVRRLRLRARLTQSGLGARANASKAYISQIEAGKRLPSLLKLIQIAEAIAVDVRVLVS